MKKTARTPGARGEEAIRRQMALKSAAASTLRGEHARQPPGTPPVLSASVPPPSELSAQPLTEPPATAIGQVFIAYGSPDRATVGALVAELRSDGITVSWDQDIRGGENFHERIRAFLVGARAVIVIWSGASSVSEFVIDEAKRAKSLGKLVTVRLPDLAPADIPFGFGSLRCEPIEDRSHLMQSLASLGVVPGADSASQGVG